MSGGKRKRDSEDMAGMEDFLQLPDDYATRMSEPGKKRVNMFPQNIISVFLPFFNTNSDSFNWGSHNSVYDL